MHNGASKSRSVSDPSTREQVHPDSVEDAAAALPEPADLPEVREHLSAGHVLQHHVEVRVVLWGRKKDDSTNKMKWTKQRLTA